MGISDIANLLKATIGLDAGSIGMPAIEHAARARQIACDLKDPGAYWMRVRSSADELQALVEAVIVPETWFFRDPQAFAMLASACYETWTKQRDARALRLLSLPCSTGEEPYSMAMALLDAGFPPSRFQIDGIDVSRHALARATKGVYGANSFRGVEQAFRDRYFRAQDDGFHVSPAVRAQVQFRQGNLFNDALFSGASAYDAVFCRNLLIYFDRATQNTAVKVLQRLLAPGGVLFVAPSETALLLEQGFVSTRWQSAFSFYHADSVAPAARTPVAKARPASGRVHPADFTVRPIAPAEMPRAQVASSRAATLDEATRLADAGRFAEAAACCEDYLRQHGPSPQAFYLLGLVRDASGARADAATFYRKALYLDPDHYEALVHFALLMEQQGQGQTAVVLRARARRLEERRPVNS